MCGIAGILGAETLATQGERQINAMLRALHPSGPDCIFCSLQLHTSVFRESITVCCCEKH